jgi:hypothetical protein
MAWPSSDLPPEFALVEDASLALVHPDGRSVIIATGPTSTVAAIHESPGKRDLTLGIYGELFAEKLTPVGEAEATKTWTGGEAMVQHLDTPHDRMVMTSLVCEELGAGFVIFAFDEKRERSHEELEALSLHVGCPRPGDPDILARPRSTPSDLSGAATP